MEFPLRKGTRRPPGRCRIPLGTQGIPQARPWDPPRTPPGTWARPWTTKTATWLFAETRTKVITFLGWVSCVTQQSCQTCLVCDTADMSAV